MRKSALIVVLVVGLIGGAGAQTVDKSYLFLKGVEHFLMGDQRGAAEIFTKSMEGGHAPSCFYLAKIAKEQNLVSDATTLIDHALQIDSTNHDFLLFRAQLYLDAQQYAPALQLFSRLLQEEQSPQYYMMNAALLLELGQVENARQMCDRFELQYGINEQMVELKRMVLIRLRNYYGAEEYMSRVVQAFPESADHLVSQAELNAALHRDSVAVSLYQRAIELDSTNVNAHFAFAEYFRKNENTAGYLEALMPVFALKSVPVQQKIDIFEKNFFEPRIYKDNFPAIRRLSAALLLSEPDNMTIRMLYGRFLTYTGQIDQALDHYKAIYDQGNQTQELAERISEILLYKKEYAKASEILGRASVLYPKNVNIAQNSVISRWLSGDGDGAIKLARQLMVRLDHTDSVRTLFYAIIGDIYHELGDDKACFRAYERALHYDSGNALVLNNYAYFLALSKRDLERALAMATRATEISTANATYLDTKAWVLFCMGQYEQARAVQRAALGLDTTGGAEYLLHYGDILYALGDDFLARTYWKKALDAGADQGVIEQRLAKPKALNNN